MFTVEQIRGDIAPHTLDSGKCRDSKYVLEYINQARRLLWPRGDFKCLVDSLCIQSSEGYLTLPYDYLKATDAQVCGSLVAIDNQWYEYADNGRFDNSCYGGLVDMGDKFATFAEYAGGNHRLAIMCEEREDKGTVINFNAIDENSSRLSLTGTCGEDHELVFLNAWIKSYRHVSKPETKGRILVFIYDPNRGVQKLCAIYEADDLAPQYRRYRVPRGLSRTGQFYVRCKRRYRPLLRETDAVEFSTDALIQACLAITARRNKDNAAFTAAMNLAVEHENQELRDDKQNTGGRLRLSRQRTVTNLLP